MSSDQQVYARWLDWGTRVALVVLVASFAAYVLALVDPHVPPQELPNLWAFPVDHYIAASGCAEASCSFANARKAATSREWKRSFG